MVLGVQQAGGHRAPHGRHGRHSIQPGAHPAPRACCQGSRVRVGLWCWTSGQARPGARRAPHGRHGGPYSHTTWGLAATESMLSGSESCWIGRAGQRAGCGRHIAVSQSSQTLIGHASLCLQCVRSCALGSCALVCKVRVGAGLCPSPFWRVGGSFSGSLNALFFKHRTALAIMGCFGMHGPLQLAGLLQGAKCSSFFLSTCL